MRVKRNLVVTAIGLGLMATGAWADGSRAFSGQLVGSTPGQHVAGVPSGGAPWVIAASEFTVSAGGKIQVEIRGLLISAGPAINTVGPVTMVSASLVCGDVVAGTTGAVPLSAAGDASIYATITVPAPCIAPALLIRIAATTAGPRLDGPFIAVNALTGSPDGDDQ